MIDYLKNLIHTQTGKDTSVVFLGTLLNVIIGGLFFILAPRILGPTSYGLFSVVMATGIMAINFANFGIDTGILRFVKDNQKETNDKILKIALKSYATIGLITFILGLLLSGPLAAFLGAPETSSLLKIAFSGTIFTLLANFFVATLQSKKRFVAASAVNISSSTARLIILVLASYFATIDLYFLTVLFFFSAITSIVLGKIFVPFDFIKSKEEQIHFKNFFGYNFWVAASLAISAIPLDNYFLVKVAGPLATGVFAAPMKILATTYQFAGSFSRVLAPRYSSFDSKNKVREFSAKASGLVVIAFTGLIFAGLFAKPIVNLFLGPMYEQSVPVFRTLSVGMAFFFAETIPVAVILYYLGNARTIFAITVFHYILYAILLVILIPKNGAYGAALAFTASEITTFLALSTYVFFKLRE